MILNITAEQLQAVTRTYGLSVHDPKVIRELTDEFNYLTRKAAAAGDSNLQQGEVSGLLDQAAQNTAARLGVRQPLPRTTSDTRDPRQRWLDSLPPEQRAHAEKWATEKNSPAEAARQQAALRQEFLNEVNARAVRYDRGNQLDDRSADYLRQKYAKLGLRNTSISRADIGQSDEVLLAHLGERRAIQSGAYKPAFRFAGDGGVEAADRPNDSREQGHRATWLGGGK